MTVPAELLAPQLPAALAALSGAFRMEELAKLLFCLVPALLFLLLALGFRRRVRRLRRRCAELSEAERLRRERSAGLEALVRSMAKTAHMDAFLVAPDDREVLFEAVENGAPRGGFREPEEYARRLAPDDRAHFLELWRQLLGGETDRFEMHCHAGGEDATALCAERAEVVTQTDGGRRLLTVVSADLSAAERQRRELRDADRMLETVFEQLPLPLFTRDANRDFVYMSCNVAFAALFGMTPELVAGKNDPELLHAPELELKLRLCELELARTGTAFEADWELPERDGVCRVYRFRETLLERADGSRIILGIGRELPRRRVRSADEPPAEPEPDETADDELPEEEEMLLSDDSADEFPEEESDEEI